MKPLALDLRKLFRKLGKIEQQAWAQAIASAGPVSRPPKSKGRASVVTGGSLSREITRPKYLSVKRWGYILRVARLGQKLTWLVRGTVRQGARPIDVPAVDADAAAEEIGGEIAASFSAWDAANSGRTSA